MGKRSDKRSFVGNIPNRVSISERSEEINLRQRFGDFEVDTVLSSKHLDARAFSAMHNAVGRKVLLRIEIRF